ncbi:MAG: cell division protein DIVIC [Johnsonella sp.]|nr:cell division protein DIVIC [Johnsonella sp.]
MKRIFALLGAASLLLLTLITLIAAFSGASPSLLFALVFCNIAFPVTIYAYIVITKQIRQNAKAEEEVREEKEQKKE